MAAYIVGLLLGSLGEPDNSSYYDNVPYTVQTLLDMKADPNYMGDLWSPLPCAIHESQTPFRSTLPDLLLRAKADPNHEHDMILYVLNFPTHIPDFDIMEQLLRAKATPTSKHVKTAQHRKYPEIVELLLEHKASLD